MADAPRNRLRDQLFTHRAALRSYLRRLTSGAEDIEDRVQETYVRVCAMPADLAVESPRALLFRIGCRRTTPSMPASWPTSARSSRSA